MLAPGQSPIFELAECQVDLGRRELRLRGAPVPIGGRAFAIIEALLRSSGELVSKDRLMDQVWPGSVVEENTLQVHISAVRKALGPLRSMLRTESGRGYRLLGPWSARERPEAAGQAASMAAIEPAPAPPEPSSQTNFPAAASTLIGRETAIQRLLDLLSAYRAVTLTGLGGIGKTALALDAARRFCRDFDGSGWLVELASLSSPDLVPSAVSSVLGLRPGGDKITAEAVARAIGERRVILVLDNCEHVIDAAAALVEAVMRLCPAATVLSTSREVLRIDGEHVYRVPPLVVPSEDAAGHGDILDHSAVALFVARARALGSDFSAEAHSLTTIASISRNLDGIPLAIEFAAARAATLGLAEVAAHLDDRFRFLTSGRRTVLPRHQTLRAALDWSYELLPAAEQRLLRRLAIFAGDFSLDGAFAVAGDGSDSSVVDCLGNLVAKSLVVADLDARVAQYRLLSTTRLYALEKLRDTGDYREAVRRHAAHYVALFASAEAESETRPQTEWLATYARHLDDVRAALDRAFLPDGDRRLGIELTVAVVPLWVQLSLLGECRERVEAALARLGEDAAPSRVRMQLSAALGWSLMYGVGRAREAGPAWTATLELAERLGDVEYQRRALWGLCIDQFNNGEFRAALDFAHRYAALAADSTDPVDLVMADRILATSWHYLGDQNNARRHIDLVIARLDTLARQPQIVRLRFDHRVSAHYFQARILWLQGFADEALRVVEHNVVEGRAIDHALTFCSVLGQAACPLTLLAGDYDAAARYGAMLLAHTERHPVRLWHLWARCFNEIVRIKRGDLDALGILRKILAETGDARFLPRFLLPIGELAAALGEAGDAGPGVVMVDETLAQCRERSEGWYVPELLRIRGELLRRRAAGRAAAEAADCFGEALDTARAQGMLFWELRAALSLARLEAERGRDDAARQALGPVYARFTEGFATADLRAAKALLEALPPTTSG
ncbi:MAG TPA: winged helix-turn-helix domain-containing protein [Stellaceae bacterium]|nr:winged helix-turn-helix domain-containing protein [Stellaceae bacterium]